MSVWAVALHPRDQYKHRVVQHPSKKNEAALEKCCSDGETEGSNKTSRRKINAKKFYIYRVCSKGETLRSSRRVSTAQGEVNRFSYLTQRRRFSGLWEPEFWGTDSWVLARGGGGTADWSSRFMWGGQAASLGNQTEEKSCQIKRV